MAFPSAATDDARQNPDAVVLDGATLTPAAVVVVARGRAPVQLDPAARTRNDDGPLHPDIEAARVLIESWGTA